MRGPSETHFGDVVSSAVGFEEAPGAAQELYGNMLILRGQIQQVYAVDNPNNSPGLSGVTTKYDVLVFRQDGSTEPLYRLMMMQPTFGGGINNFFEILGVNPGPQATDAAMNQSAKPGQFVVVGMFEGVKAGAFILGCLPHTNQIAIATRPKTSQGVYLGGEFQGLNFKIDNDGAFTMTFNGPRDDSGNPVNSNGPTMVNIDSQGNINVSTNNQQSVTIDRVTQKVTVVNGPTSVVMDGKASKITQKAATIEGLGSELNRVQGSLVKISKTPTSEPKEHLVLGDTAKEFLQKLLEAIMNITHEGNLGVLTPPPENFEDFLNLKAEYIDSGKILSDFATTEKG